MNPQQAYITAIVGVLGIILGTVLKGVGTLILHRLGDRRILKKVLFNQLDIWYEVRRADPGYFVPLMIEQLQAALISKGASADQVGELFDGAKIAPLVPFIEALKLGDPESLFGRYQESVNALAEVDPVLAYRLSGKPHFDVGDRVETFIANVKEAEKNPRSSEYSEHMLAGLTKHIKSKYQQRMLESMEENILSIAGRLGWLTKLRVRRVIRGFEDKARQQTAEGVERLIEALMGVQQSFTPPATSEDSNVPPMRS